jgi:ferredoxin
MIRRAIVVAARYQPTKELGVLRPSFQWHSKRMHSHDHSHDHGKETVTINWKNKNGSITATQAVIGSHLLSVARKFDRALEGACEGVCACSTCHIILEEKVFDSLEEPSEDEEVLVYIKS